MSLLRTKTVDRLKNAVSYLQDLNLIQSRLAYSRKGGAVNMETTRLTTNGHYVGLSGQMDNVETNNEIYNDIYKLLIDDMANKPSSLDNFHSYFLTKCRQAGLLGEQCRYYLSRLQPDCKVTKAGSLLEDLILFQLEDDSLVKKFYGKWRESVFELNEEK